MGVIFGNDVDDAPTHKLKAGLFNFLFLSERYGRNNDPKNTKATITCLGEKKGRLSVCLHMRSNYKVKISDRKLQIERGIAGMPFFCRDLTYIWNRGVVLSLDG